MNELDAMRSISSMLDAMEASEAQRVINWINDKYSRSDCDHLDSTKQGRTRIYSSDCESTEATIHKQYAFMDDIDFSDSDSEFGSTAVQIANDKLPKNKKHMCAVALWYFHHDSYIDRVSIDHIYTFFLHVGWSVPKNLANTLDQAASDGLLIANDKTNIRLTDVGDAMVDFDLKNERGSRVIRAPEAKWSRDRRSKVSLEVQ